MSPGKLQSIREIGTKPTNQNHLSQGSRGGRGGRGGHYSSERRQVLYKVKEPITSGLIKNDSSDKVSSTKPQPIKLDSPPSVETYEAETLTTE